MSFFDTIQEFLGGASEEVTKKVEDVQDTVSDPASAVEEHVQDLLGGQNEQEK